MLKKSLILFLGLLLLGTPCAFAVPLDLTSTFSGTGTIYDYQPAGDGSLWRVIKTDPTGTGVYEPFLRYQAHPEETGLNSNALAYDDKSPVGTYTRAIQFSDVGIYNVDGTNYWSFTIDFNEPGSDTRYLSFDNFDIYQGGADNITTVGALGTALFDSTATVLTDYTLASSGSGADDIEFLIPVVANDPTKPYLYLYITSGAYAGTDPGGLDRSFASEDGFEEIRTTGVGTPVPEPATMLLLGTGLMGLAGIGRKKFSKKS